MGGSGSNSDLWERRDRRKKKPIGAEEQREKVKGKKI